MMLRLVLCLFALSPLTAQTDDLAQKRVLLINSYHQEFPWTKNITMGVEQVLSVEIPPENLLIEHMDGRRFKVGPTFSALHYQIYKYKYSLIQPDIILVSDDHAYQFLLQYGDEIFPGKPIIFSGVNNFSEQQLANKPHITGIIEGLEIQKNIELIKQLQPKLGKLILVADQTEFGQSLLQTAQDVVAKLKQQKPEKHLEVEIWQDFSIAELTRDIADLSINDAVFVIIIRSDKNGQYFNYEVELPLLSQASQAPLYGMWGGAMIGNGVLGGYVNDALAVGQDMAHIALDALRNPESTLPGVTLGKFTPLFDYRQMHRHGIDSFALPSDSKVINQPDSFYVRHQLVINISSAIVLTLIFIISMLMNNIRKRVKAEQDLKQLNAELDSRIKERTRDLDSKNRDLTRASRKMHEMAYTDPLTQLGNRRGASEGFEKLLTDTQATKSELVLAMIDLDHFKHFNDKFGHDVGDAILVSAANTWRDSLRPSDDIYRWGGEEFLVLMPYTNLSNGLMICQRLKAKVSQIKHQDHNVTCSIGLAKLEPDDDMDSVIKRADVAMYQAKEAGRNCVKISG